MRRNLLTNKRYMKQLKENVYQFPAWNKIAKTYSAAVQMRLDEIKASRPFYNWREGQVDEKHIKETKEKIEGMKAVTKNGTVTIEVQLGQKWKGKSVVKVRKNYAKGEIGLGAYEAATILLINPKILQTYDDLGIDCPGDEWSPDGDGDFSKSPYFYFSFEFKNFLGELKTLIKKYE